MGTCPYENVVSIDVPTGNPATSRPPDITSSIAISSATRTGGLYSARLFPSTINAPLVVVFASTDAIRLGDGIMP